MASILELAKKINKDFKDNTLVLRSDIKPEYDRMPTGAFGLDYPLYGGLVYGRIATFAGLYHSGKTGCACLAMAAYQRANPNKMCVYCDTEHTLDLKYWVRMTGLDTTKMFYMDPKTLTGEQTLQTLLELQQADDIGMIVLDSIPGLLPAQSLENDMEDDPGMRGTIAKSLHRWLVVMSGLVSQKNNILILINQVRVAGKTRMGAPIYSEPGGQAPHYYSSIKIRFGTRTFVKQKSNGDIEVDSADGEKAIGFRLKFSITKNKCGPVARGGGFLTFNYTTGFDWLSDLIEIAENFEFIKRINNSQYELVNLETGEVYCDEEGKPLKGYMKVLKDYIITHTDFQKEYIDMLTRYITSNEATYGSILDERDALEIKAQEDSVEETRNNEAKEEDEPKRDSRKRRQEETN